MIIVQVSDFVGYLGVAQNPYTQSELQSYIDKYERKYILKIFGVSLGNSLIASLTGSPPAPPVSSIYSVIFLPFQIQQATGAANFIDGRIHISEGLKAVLVALIFFNYVLETQAQMGQSGVSQGQIDAARTISPREAARYAERKWNDSLESIDAIQWYCKWYDPTDFWNPNTPQNQFSGELFEAQANSMM